MLLPKVSLSYDDFVSLIRSEESLRREMVSYIDKDGLQHYLEDIDYMSYLGIIDKLLIERNTTIKVERYEKLCQFFEGTAHIFFAWENSPSFDTHTDPVDLIIQVTHGSKTMIVNDKEITAQAGQCLYIPANTPHCATNKTESIMISWGLDDST